MRGRHLLMCHRTGAPEERVRKIGLVFLISLGVDHFDSLSCQILDIWYNRALTPGERACGNGSGSAACHAQHLVSRTAARDT
jgi:hypothetical protein